MTSTVSSRQSAEEHQGQGSPSRRGSQSFIQFGARRFGATTSNAVTEVGEMVALLLAVLRSAVREPTGYWGNVRVEMHHIFMRCWFPVVLSTAAFAMDGPGVCGGNLYFIFGMPERLGSFLNMASVREIAPFVNMMVIAGVAGSSYTSDLGARRIREELDAMEVLGVDPVREIVLPRVIACTIMTGLLDVIACVAGVFGGGLIAHQLGSNTTMFINSFWASASPAEVWTSVAKSFIYGLMIATICCYKGLNAKGGAVGVGRAVNQAVVITFCSTWIVHYTVTELILGLHPEMSMYR
jgi:phospholipid/cholesterol/gamma-HCH transport system permease protein